MLISAKIVKAGTINHKNIYYIKILQIVAKGEEMQTIHKCISNS